MFQVSHIGWTFFFFLSRSNGNFFSVECDWYAEQWTPAVRTKGSPFLLRYTAACCSWRPPRDKHMEFHWRVFVFSCKSFTWKRAFDIFTPKIVHGAAVSQSDWLIKTLRLQTHSRYRIHSSFTSWHFNVCVKHFTSAQSGDVLFFY